MPRYIDESVPNVEPIHRRIVYLNDAGERIEEEIGEGVFKFTGIVVEFPSGQPIDPAPSAEFVPVEITYFVKESGLLSKKIRLAADGSTVIDSSDCRMSRGSMERVFFRDWRQLATGIGNLAPNTAIALGRMRPDFPEKVYLTTKDSPDCSRPGFAARTGDNIIYAPGQPAFVLLDFDTKGMTPAVKAKIDELGGFLPALYSICPELKETAHISRRSTSADIINEVTGEKREGGWHVFVLLADGTEAERVLKLLHARAWLAGLGWFLVGDAGQLPERSIVDTAVWKPERLVFEADPELDPGFSQGPRPAMVHEGGLLACPPDLDTNDEAQIEKLLAVARTAAEPEAVAKRKVWEEARIDEIVAAGGDRHKARRTIERWSSGVLLPGVTIEFEDPNVGRVTVAQILEHPERFDGETCFDPLEGAGYGRCNAMFYADKLCIHSFAHGGGVFRLRHDVESVRVLIEHGDPTKAVDILCRLASTMDIDVVERKMLAKLAGDRTGCKERVAEAALKEALAIEREARAQAFRDKAARESTTVRLPALPPDTEINPVMESWDEILANAPAARGEGQEFAEPPMRDAEGWPIRIRWRDSPGLHTLTSEGANACEDVKSRLPAPEQFLLSKHDKFSLEREVGNYITFVKKTMDGERYVAPPEKFLSHYLSLDTSKAPRVHAVMTLPVVLPDGTLLAENGLDRERRVSFRIGQALLGYIPKREDCTPEAVRAAYRFLTDEWLVDVMTDRKGKAALIAYALSIIERCLIPERPVYTVTAGQRGGGKTTVLMMIALAVLGVKPAAAAWSSDPTERKKALFSYLREGLPTLIWDNIPRGAAITCPSIERSCTAETYSDRILGISGIGTPAAFTVQTFTGNCIRPAGDLASRNLTVTITTTRPDPENRPFVHSDPLAWTWDHRGKILRALFMILLAPHKSDEGTRFKVWQRLVGSPVEFAANTPETPPEQRISFQEIFLEGEREGDDEALARGEILQALHSLFPPPPEAGANMLRAENEFSTVNVLARLSASANEAKDGGGPEEEAIVNLRYFCTTRDAKAPTVKSVPKALKSIVGATTAVAGGILTLRSRWDTHKKIPFFWVEFQPELNPDGAKTVETEAVEKAGMDAAAKIAAAAEQAAKNAAAKTQAEKMLAARQAAGPVSPFGPPVAYPSPKPNGETKPSPFRPGPPPFEDLKPRN